MVRAEAERVENQLAESMEWSGLSVAVFFYFVKKGRKSRLSVKFTTFSRQIIYVV